MPVYEYRCNDCGHEWSAYVRTTNGSPDECPNCHGTNFGKLMSTANIKMG